MRVHDSGSRNPAGRNNTTGGILLEEGTTDFRVTNCDFRNIRGNGVWTHSLYTSPRNARGLFAANTFDDDRPRRATGGTRVRRPRRTQLRPRASACPPEIVDATPVAIDTAGNVERSSYTHNRLRGHQRQVHRPRRVSRRRGQRNSCARVDGYGIVMNNTNPDMQSRNIRVTDNLLDTTLYGGIFVIGTGHPIARNRLFNINTSHCNESAAQAGCYYMAGEPDMLRSGIYLGSAPSAPRRRTATSSKTTRSPASRMRDSAAIDIVRRRPSRSSRTGLYRWQRTPKIRKSGRSKAMVAKISSTAQPDIEPIVRLFVT